MKTLSTVLLLSLLPVAHGQNIDRGFDFLSKKEIHQIIGAYPETGSDAEAEDFRILLEYQNTRTAEDCAIAASQDKVSIENLFVRNNGPLTKKEDKRVKLRLLKSYIEVGLNSHKAKKLYKRPRPYDYDSRIKPCVPKEKSYAYLSGHTTLARVIARVLSEVYPERANALMERANSVSRNRVLGGVHHPSDIVAGKKLGDEIADFIVRNNDVRALILD